MLAHTKYLSQIFSNFKIFSLFTLTSLLIVGMITIAPASALPGACNCVIFRFDDVQDYFLSAPQTAVMQKFIDRNENVTLGVIMNFIGTDQALIDKVNVGRNHPFELAIHGWNHDDYSTLSNQTQKGTLQLAKTKMQTMFGINSTIFILPYNTYNNDTLHAMQDLGIKIVSSEFDQEDVIPTPHIYIDDNTDLKDSFGIYHLPQKIEYYNVTVPVDINGNPTARPTKTPLISIMGNVTATINQYGYAVVTMHPTDFSEYSGFTPTGVVNATEITSLDLLITAIKAVPYTINSFNHVAKVQPLPLVDTFPPVLTLPLDVFFVSTNNPANPGSIGTASAVDVIDPSPVITNNATTYITNGFPQGHNPVKWTATDNKGNSASAIQYVTISLTADIFNPVIAITAPINFANYDMPPGGVNIRVNGTSIDNESGVKIVKDVETDRQMFPAFPFAATPKATNDWSTWKIILHVTDNLTTKIGATAYDFANNPGISPLVTNMTITSIIADITKPEISAPSNIVTNATGQFTPVALGIPTVFDNSDLTPIVSNNIGPGESSGFQVGTTTVMWTATDHAVPPNSSTANQTVTISNETPQITLVTPVSGSSFGPGFLANYTINEVVSSGNFTFIGTGGTDNGVIHFYNFTNDDKLIGSHSISRTSLESFSGFGNFVHGSVYTMKVAVNDAITLVSTSVSNTVLTYDATPPTFTIQYYSDSNLTAPLGDNPKFKVGTYFLKITSSEALSGTPTISIDAQGTANDRTSVATSLVSGNIYNYTRNITNDAAATGTTIENISITGTDTSTNTSTSVNPTNESTKAAFTDTISPLINPVIPATSSSVNQFNVAYTLSENVASGTITFNGTSAPDLGVVHTYNFAAGDKTSGPHTISKTTLFGSSLVNGAVYTMSVSAIDLASNVATPVSHPSITYTDPPGICPAPSNPWIIKSGCRITGLINAPGNVDIQNGAIVTIENGCTLNIDSLTKHLVIHYGSGILIKSGGKIN